MTTVPIKHGARIELWQVGSFWEDGVRHRIGPVISQTFLGPDGRWTQGFHNALAPDQSFAIDGLSEDEVASTVALFRRLAELGKNPPSTDPTADRRRPS